MRLAKYGLQLSLAAFVAICTSRMLESHAQTPDPNASIRVSPAELFTGELKRLEPHLGLISTGCFKVDYDGPELMLKSQVQVWRDGNPNPPGGSSTRITGPCEVSISVREVCEPKGMTKYEVTVAVSSKSGRTFDKVRYDLPELTGEGELKFRHTTSLVQPVSVHGDKPVPVWGFAQGRGSIPGTADLLEEMAKRAEWALVLKLSMDK